MSVRLGRQVLGAVLAQQREAGLGELVQLLERHVLHGGEQLHVGGLAAREQRGGGDLVSCAGGVLAHPGGVEPVDQGRHTTPAWRPVTPWCARWEKNRPNQHIVQRPASWTSAAPASSSLARAIAGRSRLRSPTRASAWPAKAAWTSSPTS